MSVGYEDAMEGRCYLYAGGLSLILHSVIVSLALMFVEQIKPVLQADVFKWDVSIVGAMEPDLTSEEQVAPVTTQVQASANAMPTAHNEPVPRSPRSKTPTETPKPIQSIKGKGETPPILEQLVEQQRLVEVTNLNAGPVEAPNELKPAASSAGIPPAQHEPATAAPASSKNEGAIPQEVPVQNLSHDNSAIAAPIQEADAAVASSVMPTDDRWLAESLWRRVAELKRYPNSARMNGQEGKVVVKAVIRADGHLADVSVKKSSGHELLDAAAIDVVKLACPLHMEYALGKPQIAVSIPISYSLAN